MINATILSDAAKKGAKIGNCGRMCNDCAFKSGTDANNDVAAVEAAIYALCGGAIFHCHNPDFTDAGTVCAGYKYALQYFDSLSANTSLSQEAPNTD